MGKVIDINKYKARRILLNVKREIAAMDKDYKYALVHGICDFCDMASEDVRFFPKQNKNCCDGCVPEMANEKKQV